MATTDFLKEFKRLERILRDRINGLETRDLEQEEVEVLIGDGLQAGARINTMRGEELNFALRYLIYGQELESGVDRTKLVKRLLRRQMREIDKTEANDIRLHDEIDELLRKGQAIMGPEPEMNPEWLKISSEIDKLANLMSVRPDML